MLSELSDLLTNWEPRTGMGSGSRSVFGNPKTVEITGKIMVVAIILLFLVVVFVLILHVYAKWYWWRTEQPPVPPPATRRQRRRFVFAPGQDPLRTAGLDPSILRSLPVVVFRPQDFKDGLECAVCLSELVEGDKARLLTKCNHGFHVDCIDMWFQSHSTCPLCRNMVAAPDRVDSVRVGSVADDTAGHVLSPYESLASGYSMEAPNFPTNILFWGNQTQVSTGVASFEDTATTTSSSLASQSPCSPSPSTSRLLVIDIPTSMSESVSSSSPMRFAEEESKSPMPTRLRSLKRLLSRDKRVVPNGSSSSSVEV